MCLLVKFSRRSELIIVCLFFFCKASVLTRASGAFYQKVLFSFQANKTHFHKKSFALAWSERRSSQLVHSTLTKGRVYSADNCEKVANIIIDYCPKS